MTGTKRKFPPCLAALTVLLALLLVVSLALVLPWVERMNKYEEEVGRHNQQMSGFTRVINTLPSLQARLDAMRANREQDVFYLDAANPSLGGIALQRRIEELMAVSGGTLTSIQIMPAQQEASATRITVRLRFNGSTEELQKLLYGIESNQPALFVGTTSIRALRRPVRRTPGRQQVQVQRAQSDLNVNLDVHGYIRGVAG
jgi:general secretion pathway protein M